MDEARRKFLRTSVCGLTGAAMVASLDRFSLVNAMVQQDQPDVAADYKALVCIFLNGGSDCNNMVIPYDDYTVAGGGTTNGYDNVRTGSGLAIPKSALANTKITPSNTGGVAYALHPNLSPEFGSVPGQAKGLMDIWSAGKLAVLCNVGSLVQPITRAQYAAGIGRPYQLFSHSDQVAQQQTSVAKTVGQTGWGGRIADKTNSLNGTVALPMNISLAGTNLFSTGINSRQLAIAAAPTTLANLLVLNWNGPSGANPNNTGSSFRTLLGFDQNVTLVKGATDTTSQALTADAALNQTEPVIPSPGNPTAFPNTSLGNQLKQIAKLIKIRDAVGITMKRQIFFCSVGGFDTHTNETGSDPTNPGGQGAQSGTQGGLLTQISQAMRAFYDEMVAQGLSNNVTTFTLSDFGERCNRQAQAQRVWAPITPGAVTRSSWAVLCWAANSMDQSGRTTRVCLMVILRCNLAVRMTRPVIAVNGYQLRRLISMRRRWRIGMAWTRSPIGRWYFPISSNLPRRNWASSADNRKTKRLV